MAEATLDGFAAALLSPPATEAPPGVANPFGGAAVKRFGVYRNNVAVGLKGALGDIFPVTRDLVGDGFFGAMAMEYIAREPPRSPVLARYGRSLPAFIAAFAPAANLPFLADVARLERAWLDAYHARDAAPLAPEVLTGRAPENLMTLRLEAHPAARLLAFETAAATIFGKVKAAASLKGVDPSVGERALVARPYYDVAVHALDAATFAFFEALLASDPIGDAAEAALAIDASFDLAAGFSLLLGSGAFTAITGETE